MLQIDIFIKTDEDINQAIYNIRKCIYFYVSK